MTGPYRCCVHCRADEAGSHQYPCGHRGCSGSAGATFVSAHVKVGILCAAAALIFMTATLVLR